MPHSTPLLRALLAAALFSPLPLAAQARGFTPSQGDPGRAGRLALVIGNAGYADSPLRNPVNDARDMASALRALGFRVLHVEDADQRAMKRAIQAFGDSLRGGAVGLFYYAGHGVQSAGRNYMIPVGARIRDEAELEYEAVDVGFALAQMEAAGNGLNLVILDACRNNPYARRFRSTTRGLASIDAPAGTLIAYATAPGSVASDGEGRNGLYTQELLRHLHEPGLPVEQVFKRVRIGVMLATNGEQTPWESSSLVGEFAFVGDGVPVAAASPPPPGRRPSGGSSDLGAGGAPAAGGAASAEEVAVLLNRAFDVSREGDHAAAFRMVEQGLTRSPGDLMLAEYAGHFAIARGDQLLGAADTAAAHAAYDRGLSYYDEVFARLGGRASEAAVRNALIALRRLGSRDKAVEFGAWAVLAKPDDARVHTLYGHALQDAGRGGEALEMLERAESLDPSEQTEGPRISLLLEAGRWREASRLTRAAIRDGYPDPDLLGEALFAHAINTLVKGERWEEAGTLIEETMTLYRSPEKRARAAFYGSYALQQHGRAIQTPQTCASARQALPVFQRAEALVRQAAAFPEQPHVRLQVEEAIATFIEIQQALIARDGC